MIKTIFQKPLPVLFILTLLLVSLLLWHAPKINAETINGGTYSVDWDQAACKGSTNGTVGQKFVGGLAGDNFTATIHNPTSVTMYVEFTLDGGGWDDFDLAPGASQAVTLTNMQNALFNEIRTHKKGAGCTISASGGVKLEVMDSASLTCINDPGDNEYWRLDIAYDTFEDNNVVTLFQASTLIVTNLDSTDFQTQRKSTGEAHFYLRFGNTTGARLVAQATCPSPPVINSSGGGASGGSSGSTSNSNPTNSNKPGANNQSSPETPAQTAATGQSSDELTKQDEGQEQSGQAKKQNQSILYIGLGSVLSALVGAAVLAKLGVITLPYKFLKP